MQETDGIAQNNLKWGVQKSVDQSNAMEPARFRKFAFVRHLGNRFFCGLLAARGRTAEFLLGLTLRLVFFRLPGKKQCEHRSIVSTSPINKEGHRYLLGSRALNGADFQVLVARATKRNHGLENGCGRGVHSRGGRAAPSESLTRECINTISVAIKPKPKICELISTTTKSEPAFRVGASAATRPAASHR